MPHFVHGSAPKLRCHPRSYCRCGDDRETGLKKNKNSLISLGCTSQRSCCRFEYSSSCHVIYAERTFIVGHRHFLCHVANTRGSLLSEQQVVHHGRASGKKAIGLNAVLMTAGKTGTSAVKRVDLEEPARTRLCSRSCVLGRTMSTEERSAVLTTNCYQIIPCPSRAIRGNKLQ